MNGFYNWLVERDPVNKRTAIAQRNDFGLRREMPSCEDNNATCHRSNIVALMEDEHFDLPCYPMTRTPRGLYQFWHICFCHWKMTHISDYIMFILKLQNAWSLDLVPIIFAMEKLYCEVRMSFCGKTKRWWKIQMVSIEKNCFGLIILLRCRQRPLGSQIWRKLTSNNHI